VLEQEQVISKSELCNEETWEKETQNGESLASEGKL